MKSGAVMAFSAQLSDGRSGVSFRAIAACKHDIAEQVHTDGDKLHNDMIGSWFLQQIRQYHTATFVPDERSVNVSSGN